ncbi:coproporphyrinogen dehydrogenase HemZ [Anaeromicrobium sediminis]|uniref:Coproporphyrinogen dehydrogenase HemZ n=1 Tax=Anaeromicrobium sediminis TaxID=1478221 RepID=A0A267MPR8_9FIRM|nr:coproporphyrinogen dehydrogenase HemZ [Anaeromicrobium sediminis]PAB60905.1 coproporphyrinogen dehydrogenase HemZ [Anaeromicrobium sediminis]
MIHVKLEGHDYEYEIGELIKVFYNVNEFQFTDKIPNGKLGIINKLYYENEKKISKSSLYNKEELIMEIEEEFKVEDREPLRERKLVKQKLKLTLFELLAQYTKRRPKWGILTGIRPTKIVYELMSDGCTEEEIKNILKIQYRLSEEKIQLLINIVNIEKNLMKNKKDYVSIYIGIPFCPTKCLYCSFPSNSICEKNDKREAYIESLAYEIKEVSMMLKEANKRIDTIYIGGGTPTSLTNDQLEKLFVTIKENLDLSEVREFTVEAGRPDTITMEKLKTIKNHGIERISINPQTMNDSTLKLIGRNHTVEDIKNTYELARQIGFKTINMDLIIGLPNEGIDEFENTMKEIIKLDPENITVHTLAIKKSSILKANKEKYKLCHENSAEKMIEMANKYCKEMTMSPYYMYRQKYMVGNLENIGYAKVGHECIYNIEIIEEKQTIIALGAGAISKVYYPDENRLERVPNVTSLDHYIDRTKEMVERKKKELLGNNMK